MNVFTAIKTFISRAQNAAITPSAKTPQLIQRGGHHPLQHPANNTNASQAYGAQRGYAAPANAYGHRGVYIKK